MSDRSKYTDDEGVLRYSTDGSEVFPGATGVACLDGPGECEGAVEYRTTPDRTDLKAFPRCEAHFTRRMASVERNLELTSDVPPAWFDPAAAGESWDEDR